MLWLVGFLTWIILGTTPHERAISAVDQAVARMVGTLPDPGQGESPAKPDDAPIREVLAREGTSKVADVLDLLIRGGLRLHFRSVSDGQEAFRVNYENNTLVTFPPPGRSHLSPSCSAASRNSCSSTRNAGPKRCAGWGPRPSTAGNTKW